MLCALRSWDQRCNSPGLGQTGYLFLSWNGAGLAGLSRCKETRVAVRSEAEETVVSVGESVAYGPASAVGFLDLGQGFKEGWGVREQEREAAQGGWGFRVLRPASVPISAQTPKAQVWVPLPAGKLDSPG